MTATYKLSNGEYQSPLEFNTIGKMLYMFSNEPNTEFLVNCEIENVNKLLKGFRAAKGLTLQQVANGMSAKYDRSVINNIEAGRRKLGLTTLLDIAQSMGIDVEITFKGKCDFIKELPYEADFYDEMEIKDFEDDLQRNS